MGKTAVMKILDSNDRRKIRTLFCFNKTDNPELTRKKFLIWSRYFFTKFFESADAPFHEDIDRGNIGVYLGKNSSFLDIAFRGSAKTTRTKLFIAYAIANDLDHYRRYIKVLAKDIGNSKQAVTDVYNLLINKRVHDLYPEIFEKTTEKREETMSSFTTATGVKMTSDSVGTDQRGDIQDEARPDLIWFDDFETRLTLTSAVMTHKIWQNMEEARTGLSKDGGCIYNCNYLSERGNVHRLVTKIDNKVIIPIEFQGEPTWARYTRDDIGRIKKEAEDYEGEYLCMPSTSKDVFFDRASVERQTPGTLVDEIAGLKIWRKYDPSHRVGSGHDVSGGVGLDSSTSVFIDFDTMPMQVLATYRNNEIKPDVFAYELVNQAKHFGMNYIGVEKNYGSTIDILKNIYPHDKIHKTQRVQEKIVYHIPLEYGWETNWSTKNTMLMHAAQIINSGLIVLNDPELIAEVRAYTRNDLMDADEDVRLSTRHFDLLMALCIALQMNSFIKRPERPIEDEFLIRRSQERPVNPAI